MFDHGYVLLIGVDQNKIEEYALPVVAKDIEKLREVITHPDRCAYPDANVLTLTAEDATRGKILEGLDWLGKKLESDKSENATALIYYSGHGHRVKETDEFYLLPYEAFPLTLYALPAKAFADKIAGIKPRRLLVVLDCCHAEGMDVKGDVGGESITPTAITPATPGFAALAREEGRAVLSSSRGHQKSWIRDDNQISVFTYHLLEALTGHIGRVGTPEVLVTEVMDYFAKTVPETAKVEKNAAQIPVFDFRGTAFPLALIMGGKGLAKGATPPDPFEKLRVVSNLKVGTVKKTGKAGAMRLDELPDAGEFHANAEAKEVKGELIGVEIGRKRKPSS